MRATLIAVAGLALVVVTMSAQANEKPSDAFMKAMRDNADATRAIRVASKEFEESGAGAQDFDPFEKAAATMKASFTTTLTYFQGQRSPRRLSNISPLSRPGRRSAITVWCSRHRRR
jgi:hypothetical protein